jgi:flagellar basal-body rod protein FlgB
MGCLDGCIHDRRAFLQYQLPCLQAAAGYYADAARSLASNIANVETPNYKRVDLPKDFSKEFATHLQSGTLDELDTPALVTDTQATSQRLDGNNVEIDKELTAMSSNTLQYNALTEFVSASLKQLKVAITGRS